MCRRVRGADLDICRTANVLVKECGAEQAPLMAAKRADELLNLGDVDGQRVNVLLRAITKNQRTLESAVMMSSATPSAKNSCSGSPLMFWNGSTAIDGLSGRESAVARGCGPPPAAPPSSITR
jgi:hypothetical protein